MSRFALIRALLVVAVCAMSGSVWLAAESQRSAAVLLGVLGGLGYLLVEWRSRMEERSRARHAAFKDSMQMARSEPEAYDVLKSHLESWLPDAVVLNRSNSTDGLEATTPLPEASPARETPPGVEHDECLAIRTGKVHARGPGDRPLLSCQVCSVVERPTTCVPSLVGGERVGSVLLEHSRPLRRHERAGLVTAVSDAAPVIANFRNIALAEMRAVTDALTGLANTRAIHETAKRMAAQASRTVTPLAAVLFDLDHFKQINDAYGHRTGDQVLAAVGDAVGEGVRDSDFVGRYGGEEFLVLLPDTDRQGAVLVAEKLRHTIARVPVPELDGRLSASFGVAVLPDHAGEVTQLLRCADRALYLAKANGRDRVEVFEAPFVGGTSARSPESD